MRRLTAVISLIAFMSLVFVQASGACPMSADQAHVPAATAVDHAGHDGHDTPAAPNHHLGAPAGDASHAPGCLLMGPCLLTLDVSVATVVTGPEVQPGFVVAVSDVVPRSLTTSPEIPPPRA